ncbi:MAG: polyprenyl synthetase family protein [Orrella sp.]|uniref:polyprenyl synthetase family protein n=1 Tax=Orrella sp. TaxID=1921583 RepID=UPI003BE9335D
MKAVDLVIRECLDSDVVLIRTIGDYIIGSGGKRIRPAMVLLSAKAFGYKGDQHLKMAAVIEFIHTATLLHDDVVDESALRRGRSTANEMFGNAASVLVGDYLYSRAFEMMVDVNRMAVMQVMSQATKVISEGEVLQLMNVNDPDVTQEKYLQVVRFKTAKLFEAAARTGAILADASQTLQEAAAAYGRHMGTAFQLIDDLLDYSGDPLTLGKTVGDDLREGKPTLPLLRVLEVGSAADKAMIRQAIEHGDGDFEAVAQAIGRTDALEHTRLASEAEVSLAIAALEVVPDSDTKTLLQQLAAHTLTRTH